jgi:hypothetical protein
MSKGMPVLFEDPKTPRNYAEANNMLSLLFVFETHSLKGGVRLRDSLCDAAADVNGIDRQTVP